jgi:hypothetical protein
LTVIDPVGLVLTATTLAIRDATLVRWAWRYHGRPHTSENVYFYEYARSGTKIDAKTNVDWYKPEPAPMPRENAVEIL